MEESDDRKQAVATCYSQFKGKAMTPNDTLLAAIRSRGQKQTEFGYGIRTADVFVRTLAERIGIDSCYKYAASRTTSFDDILQKAGRTLVYSNSDMVIEEKDVNTIRKDHDIELPKNTLMVFKHTLTTSAKDRDGDVLHAAGAVPDPKMLLLWQHLHTMPIGKAIAIADQNDEHLKMVSCIVDMNETSHDAAVMVDNDMGRFSHGFRAIDFEEIKEGDKKRPSGAFDIKEYEIMEESLVSVPANVDATTEEVMLSLVEGGKLTSPMMKEYGKVLREKRSVQVPVTFREIQCSSFGELKQAHEAGLIAGVTKAGGKSDETIDDKRGRISASEEADEEAVDNEGRKADGEEEGADKKMKCPECGGVIKDGKCTKCDYVVPKLDVGKNNGPGGHKPDGTGPHGAGAGPGSGRADGSGKATFGKEDDEGDDEPKGKPQKCPKCGSTKIKDGKCEECGYVFPQDEESKAVDREERAKLDAMSTGKNVKCPKCGYTAPMNYWSPGKKEYLCPECKADMSSKFPAEWLKKDDKKSAEVIFKHTKQGRTISKANEVSLQDAVDDLKEVGKMAIARPAKALVKSATSTLISVLKQIEKPETNEQPQSTPMSLFIASSTLVERKTMKHLLEVFERSEQRAKEVRAMRPLLSTRPAQ